MSEGEPSNVVNFAEERAKRRPDTRTSLPHEDPSTRVDSGMTQEQLFRVARGIAKHIQSQQMGQEPNTMLLAHHRDLLMEASREELAQRLLTYSMDPFAYTPEEARALSEVALTAIPGE